MVFLKKNMFITFITWTEENTSTMLGYTRDIISDLTPLIIPIIAIGLGLLIFTVVIKSIRGD